jgi:hypothetical protein
MHSPDPADSSTPQRFILIDIARTWDRLALELEHSTARITPEQVLRPPYEIFTRK